MRYIDATSIGAIMSVLDKDMPMVYGAGVFSMLYGAHRGKGLSKARRKKMARRRYRMFVDNVIMHHKRLHDRNREVTINLAKSRINSRRKTKDPIKSKAKTAPLSRSNSLSQNSSLAKKAETKWRDRFDSKERTMSIKGRIDARRMRARSRWRSAIDKKSGEVFDVET